MNTKEKIKREFDEISTKIDNLTDDDGSTEEREELNQKRDTLRNMWEEVKDTSEDAWDNIKEGFEHGIEELKSTYHGIKSKV